MIPYFSFTTIALGPVHIQVWGLFVALGIGLALLLGRKECTRRGLDKEAFTDFASWAIMGALIGARLAHAFLYEPAAYLADPLRLLRVWEGGMSMFGGLVGGAIGAAWYARRSRIAFFHHADVAAYVLPLGYGIGRIGCFLIHDHPGTLSDSFLAVRFPGGDRLDHGLLLSLVGFGLMAVFYMFNRREPRLGFLPAYMVSYGAIRFILDFQRAIDLPGADARYGGLTPGQYGALALVAAGVAVWRMRRQIYGLLQERRA